MSRLFSPLSSKVEVLLSHLEALPAARKVVLSALVDEIRQRRSANQVIQLNFICTHNSRRSQLGQVWAALAAQVHGVARVETYSGGTEATAFNPRAVAALERAGFRIEAKNADGVNPRYLVRFSDYAEPICCFSKVYDAPENPRDDFIAVMTCGEADQNCPVIFGAKGIPLLYDDPKVADGTNEETRRYDERSDQIAMELLWVFREVKQA